MDTTADVIVNVTHAAQEAAGETVGKVTNEFVHFLQNTFNWNNLFKTIGVLLILFIIWLVFAIIKGGSKKMLKKSDNPHLNMLILRTINYAYVIVSLLYLLSVFGIKVTAILGAAGVAGVAIGFAAQTTISNFISGLFVLGERTMKVGDFISCGGVAGTVDSVGLLSIKVHNTDGQMIRIPNSQVMNSNFQNNSFFETRRMCFTVSVAYESDFRKALEVLATVPAKCSTVLTDPESKVWYEELGASGVDMVLAVWFKPSDLIQTKNDVFMNILETFKAAGIEIPYTKVDVNIVKTV
ncbi:MAG: mechanosensitive ion channel family protein [Spirochaetales bacterium]|nr:mechanosensitive ion channel family protein [Spirochaetales bacterium]